jgi:hypothetical protein
MILAPHAQHDLAKHEIVALLARSQRVPIEVREDLLHDRRHTIHGPGHHAAVGTLGSDLAAAEERPQTLQDVDPISMLIRLNHGSDVPPTSGRHAVDGGAEAPFPIHEPGHVPG